MNMVAQYESDVEPDDASRKQKEATADDQVGTRDSNLETTAGRWGSSFLNDCQPMHPQNGSECGHESKSGSDYRNEDESEDNSSEGRGERLGSEDKDEQKDSGKGERGHSDVPAEEMLSDEYFEQDGEEQSDSVHSRGLRQSMGSNSSCLQRKSTNVNRRVHRKSRILDDAEDDDYDADCKEDEPDEDDPDDRDRRHRVDKYRDNDNVKDRKRERNKLTGKHRTMDRRTPAESNLVKIRHVIESNINFRKAANELLNIHLEPNQELCSILLEYCSQERINRRYYGLLGQHLCTINKVYQENFEKCFVQQYSMIDRLKTDKLENVAKFFAHLLGTFALPWHVLSYIRLHKEDTSSSHKFIKILFQELSWHLGIKVLNNILLQDSYESIFPKDDPANTRFCIKFFRSIGLPDLTQDLREYSKNKPHTICHKQPPRKKGDPETVTKSSSSDSVEYLSDSGEGDSKKKRKRRRKLMGL